MLSSDSLDIQRAAEQGLCLLRTSLAERIVNPLAILAGADKSGVQQDAHMMGQRGLADLERLLQLAGAALAILEKMKNRQSILVAHRLEHARCHLIGLIHDTTL